MNDRLASLRRIPYEVLEDGEVVYTGLSDQLVMMLEGCPSTPRVREWLFDLLTNVKTSGSIVGILEENPCLILQKMDALDSPLEVAAACWLFNELHYYRESYKPFGLEISVWPQQTIEVERDTYRVDFLVDIKVESKDVVPEKYRGAQTLVAIECDGHEYHEKTKEQAARDKRRDRILQAAGIPVLRFTGSEIYGGRTATMAQALAMAVNIFCRANGIKTSMYRPFLK